MKENQRTIRQYLEAYKNGEFNNPDRKTQIDAGWYDWFCKDSSLHNKTKALTSRLRAIVKSAKIDQDTMYVFFKNSSLYDDFRICDMKTGNVMYSVTPKYTNGTSEVWGHENAFEGPLVEGTWKDVKKFFLG